MHMKQSVATFVRRMLLGVGALALLVAFMAAPHGTASAWSKAFVRVVHASPAAGPVDVYVDGSKLLHDFTFGSVTGYVPVAAGSHRIQVAPEGKGRGASVIDVTVLSGGTYYTVAALGTQSSGFSLKAFVDNNWVRDEKAKVRVYHLSPDAGPVDVAVGGTTVIKDLTYKHASGYLTVAPGSYTFEVTAVDYGVTIPIKAQLKEENVYSIFAVGLVKGSPSLQFVISAFNSEND